jgi:hypothetical protein
MEEKIFIEGIEVKYEHLGAGVLYMPDHAIDEDHPDCEVGVISTVNNDGIWARFYDGDTGSKCPTQNLRWL